MEPESNHVSSTSGTRRINPSHCQHENTMSSTMCLCKSFIFFPLASSSSDALPNTRFVLHFSHTHTGMTLAQKRCRLIDQSRAPSSHLPQRPSLICSGDQLMPFALRQSSLFIFVTATNHDEVA